MNFDTNLRGPYAGCKPAATPLGPPASKNRSTRPLDGLKPSQALAAYLPQTQVRKRSALIRYQSIQTAAPAHGIYARAFHIFVLDLCAHKSHLSPLISRDNQNS